MKNIKNIIGIIVFAAIIVLATVSCWSPTGDSVGPGNKGNEINVVDIAAIEGVAVPEPGGTPVTKITENEQYSGTVLWEPEHSVFETKTHYTATITLTAKTGFTLEGITTNFFSVHGAISTNNHANSGIVTAVFPSTAGTETDPVVIDITNIEGLTPPVTGGIPVTTIAGNTQYSGTVTWEPDHSVFEASTHYTATITLTVKTGFTIGGIAADFFSVHGAISTSYSEDSGVITVVFPSTPGTTTNPVTIEISEIGGVLLPVTGETPVAHITENEEYSGTVAWEPNHSLFEAATHYRAIITLTVKEGYTLQGIPENFFTVEDAISVSNSADSGVITVVFPSTAGTSTGPVTIDMAAIHGVAVPVYGRNPVTTITETEQYTGTVEWSPVVAKTAQVNIAVHDYYGDGWGSGGLKVFRNGVEVTTLLKPPNGSTAYAYGLSVSEGMVIDVYWVAGADQGENSFIMYYADTPPSPSFTSSNNNSWNGSNALLYRLRGTMNGITDGTLLGSFTVALPPGLYKSATQYTATITLTPKEGYTLQGVGADFFTVAGATSVNNLANSGVITVPFPRTAYGLGDTGPGGGKIFYYSEAGFTVQGYGDPGDVGYFAPYTAHYLEAAPNNMPTTLAWASSDYTDESIPDAKYAYGVGGAQSLGAGRKNTSAILAIDADAPAAKACAEYNNLGLTDWFLPSEAELKALYDYRSYVGNIAGTQNYWTSTEAVFTDSSAYARNFNANIDSTNGKSSALNVRAIRAF